jgi:hypothetical protein
MLRAPQTATAEASANIVKRCCSSDVHANAQRCDAEMELDRDNLLGGSDNRDGWREKTLHIRLD